MNLSAPTQAVFFISLILAVIGLLAGFGVIAAVSSKAFLIMAAAWVVMTAGVILKGI